MVPQRIRSQIPRALRPSTVDLEPGDAVVFATDGVAADYSAVLNPALAPRAQALRVFRRMGLSWSRDAARVAFYTGWRISEVLQATAVHTPSGLALAIPDTKNGQPRMVPVHRRIEHLVREHWPPQVTKWTASKETKKALRAVFGRRETPTGSYSLIICSRRRR